MAPKPDIHEEQVLQAVILAQCEQDYGDPVTQDVPKVLAPVANTPLLEYSLEWLERCGVEEAIVYCRADTHLQAIKEHCRAFMSRRWDTTPSSHPGGLRVTVVASEDCYSVGDAMRDLYAKGVLKGDFVLLQGDTVTTLDLPTLVTEHRESRAADRSAIMTCVYLGEGGRVGSTAERATTATLLVDAATNKLLLHRRRGGRSTSSRLAIPTELLQGSHDILTYPAAYDPSVTICSEVVPSLFSDNFDYSTLDSLVRGVIEQEELLGYTIKARMVQAGYAGRAAYVPSLIAVSGEVVQRQAYPLVPEVSQTSHRVRYHHDPFTHTYWDPSAKCPRGSGVTGVVVGAGVEVSPSAHLHNTTLGDHCTLGESVVVNDSVVMGGVCIKAGSVVEQCWVGEGAVVGEKVVARGCVLGAGVVLGDGVTLPPGTRLTVQPPLGVSEPDPAVCGEGGLAYVVEQEEEEEEEEEDEEEEDGRGGGEMEEEEDSEEEMPMSDDEFNMSEFQHELQESLATALREGSAAENVVLEINASRHAYNVSMEDVVVSVVQGVLKAGQERSVGSKGAEALWPAVKGALTTFQGVLRNYVKRSRDQIIVLNAVESLVKSCPAFLPLAKGVLYEMNQAHELLDDEVIVAWYRGELGGAGGGVGAAGNTSDPLPALRTALAKFVEWLEEEEEESEEDD